MYLWSKGVQELFVQHIFFECVLVFRYFTVQFENRNKLLSHVLSLFLIT